MDFYICIMNSLVEENYLKGLYNTSQEAQGREESIGGICRELKISQHTFYLWKRKYSRMDNEMLRSTKK